MKISDGLINNSANAQKIRKEIPLYGRIFAWFAPKQMNFQNKAWLYFYLLRFRPIHGGIFLPVVIMGTVVLA